ncbi:MAG: hypothetical protein ABSD20_02575 [Terriglobales bacterium]|jgi:hypothetical protein
MDKPASKLDTVAGRKRSILQFRTNLHSYAHSGRVLLDGPSRGMKRILARTNS